MKRRSRVSEPVPVQVYLAGEDRERLDRLTEGTGQTKADVVRAALRAYEERLLDPESHPLLRIAGLGRDREALAGYDPAVEHDRAIAEARWKSS